MSIITIVRLMKEREALATTGRIYVNAVKRYMESEGYFIQSDAQYTGETIDLVYKRPKIDNEWLTIVECKNTSTSPRRKDFAKQIFRYLAFSLQYPTRYCYFVIFIKDLTNDEAWEDIFGEGYCREKILDYIDKFLPVLGKNKKESKLKRIIEQEKGSEKFYLFFENAKVIIANAETLIEKSKAVLGDYPSFIEKYANEMNKIWLKRASPYKKLGTIFVNLYPLILPRFIYAAPLKTSLDEMIEDLKGIWRPPYHSHSRRIFTYAPFNNENSLAKYIDPDSTIRYKSSSYFESEERINILRQLTNSWLHKLARSKGLRRGNNRIYYFTLEIQNETDVRSIPWSKNPNGKAVVRPYFKNEELNFVYHRACLVRTEILNQSIHVKLLPRKLYSSNGVELLDQETMRNIEQAFRKSMMSYNQNLLNELEFWREILFNPTRILTLEAIQHPCFPEPKISDYEIYSLYTPIKHEDIKESLLKHITEYF